MAQNSCSISKPPGIVKFATVKQSNSQTVNLTAQAELYVMWKKVDMEMGNAVSMNLIVYLYGTGHLLQCR